MELSDKADLSLRELDKKVGISSPFLSKGKQGTGRQQLGQINQPLGLVPLRISQRRPCILLVEQRRQPSLNPRRQS
jgi:hypothetical protein